MSTVARPRPPQNLLEVPIATSLKRSIPALPAIQSGGRPTEVTTSGRPAVRTGWRPRPGTFGPAPSMRASVTHPPLPAHLPFQLPPLAPLFPLLLETVVVNTLSAVVRAGAALLAANPERYAKHSISGTPSAFEPVKPATLFYVPQMYSICFGIEFRSFLMYLRISVRIVQFLELSYYPSVRKGSSKRKRIIQVTLRSRQLLPACQNAEHLSRPRWPSGGSHIPCPRRYALTLSPKHLPLLHTLTGQKICRTLPLLTHRPCDRSFAQLLSGYE